MISLRPTPHAYHTDCRERRGRNRVYVGTRRTDVVTGIRPFAWSGRFRAVLGSRSAAASLCALVLISFGAAACLMIWHGRQSAFGDHLRDSDSLGVVLAEQTGRYVQVVDLIVQEVRSKAIALDLKTLEDFQ